MALNLSKAAPAINLTKSVPNQTKYTVGLAWDGDGDLDASAVVLNGGAFKDLAFFKNLEVAGVKHYGDALDGQGEGDDETIDIDLSKVEGDEVVIAITSYHAGTFGAGHNAVAKLYKAGDTTPLVEANLSEEAAFGTAVVVVRLFKEGEEWKFENISENVGSSENGLEDVGKKYGFA